MNDAARRVQTTYLVLLLLHTLAASFIWGINTLFLLDAGLSNTEAFAANAFFTAGMVIFEVPTGVLADTRGRRTSYLLGTITLAFATLLYLLLWRVKAPLAAWAVASALLGLGFTFFSGAVEAWLVDALTFSGFTKQGGRLEDVFARGEIVEGIAMLGGSIAGGVVAQATNLGMPYLLRVGVLVLSFATAFALMHDIGFTPRVGTRPVQEIKNVLRDSIANGLAKRPVRWVMLTGPFTGGVTIYAFYAMQPYLLELWGDERAFGIAGLAAATVAGAQIAGGLLVPHLKLVFGRRTTVLLTGTLVSVAVLASHRSRAGVLGGHHASLVVGADVCGGDSRPSVVSQRAHRVEATRDRVVVRFAAGIERRRGDPATSRKDGGRLGLPDLVCGQRRDPGAGDPVLVAGAARAHAGGPDAGGT